jgi:CRP-like cAMP-binding protein
MAERTNFLPLFADRKVVNLLAGDVLFESGDPSTTMYVVKEGAVRIHEHGITLEIVGPGGLFGEMALVDRLPRSAAATAEADTVLLEVDEAAFLATLKTEPLFALDVLKIVTRRLRETNKLLAKFGQA